MPCRERTGAMAPCMATVEVRDIKITDLHALARKDARRLLLPLGSPSRPACRPAPDGEKAHAVSCHQSFTHSNSKNDSSAARVWLGPAVRHRHGQPNDVILARLGPLLHRHRGIGGVLVWDRCELPIFPLEHDGALGCRSCSMSPGAHQPRQGPRRLMCGHNVQADRRCRDAPGWARQR